MNRFLSLPKRTRRSVLFFAVLLCCCLAIQFVFGIRIAPDSKKYINSSTLVSPVYPIFLDICELIFGASAVIQGQPAYIFFAVLLQNIFLAWALFSMLECFRERFRLNYIDVSLLAAGFLGFSVLQTVFTVEGRIASNTVMSEGLSFPLYYLFFKYLFLAVDGKVFKPLLTATVLAFLMTNTRGQLYFTVILLLIGAIVIYRNTRRPTLGQFIRRLLLTALVYFGATLLLTNGYNKLKSGVPGGNALVRCVLLGAQMYTADEEDALLFEEGSAERQIFDATMDLMKEKKYRCSDAGKGVYNRFTHYELACDPIQNSVRLRGEALCAANGPGYDINGVYNNMILKLFKDNAGRFLGHCLVNAFGGIVRSVLLFKKPLIIAACGLYALVFALLIGARVTGKHRDLMLPLAICTVSIFLNALFCAPGVWCLSRYMVYNLPVMYMCLYLIFITLFREKTGRLSQTRPEGAAL